MRISILTCFPLLNGTIGGKHILCISIPSWEAFDLEMDDILEPSCSYGFVGSKSKPKELDRRKATHQRLQAARDTQDFDQTVDALGKQGEMERFDF